MGFSFLPALIFGGASWLQILCPGGRDTCSKDLSCPIVALSIYSSLQNPPGRRCLSCRCPLGLLAGTNRRAGRFPCLALPGIFVSSPPRPPPSWDTSRGCAVAAGALCPWRASCRSPTAGRSAGAVRSRGRVRRGGGVCFLLQVVC